MIKIISGIRGCGKTFLLFTLYHGFLISNEVKESNIMADLETKELCDPEVLFKTIMGRITDKDEKCYVFIDEAQNAISKAERKDKDAYLALYGILKSFLNRTTSTSM